MKKLIASILTIILLFSMNLSYAFAGAGATDSNGHRDDVEIGRASCRERV